MYTRLSPPPQRVAPLFWPAVALRLAVCQDYLGEKIAVYFALLGHYTTWLGPLSIMGIIVSIDQIVEWNLDAISAPYFSVFVSFWAVGSFWCFASCACKQ